MNTSNRNAPTPSTFAEAAELLGSRDSRKIGHNTFLERLHDGTIGVLFHRTYIVRFHEDGGLTLNSGGWQTVTTKERMNRYLRPLGFGLYAVRRVWHIDTPTGETLEFEDGLRIGTRATDEVQA